MKAYNGHKHWSLWTLVAMTTAPPACPVGCLSGQTQTRHRSLAARDSGKHTSVFPMGKSPDLGRMLRGASQPEWLVSAPRREAWTLGHSEGAGSVVAGLEPGS